MADARTQVTALAVLRAAAAFFELDKTVLLSKDRARRVARPRQIAMALCHELGLPVEQIARDFAKDRTTITWAVQAIGELRGTDPVVARDYDGLRKVVLAAYSPHDPMTKRQAAVVANAAAEVIAQMIRDKAAEDPDGFLLSVLGFALPPMDGVAP